jgi:cyclophilin family peptidyl-prolyl cis-trans isomerase
MKRLLLSVTMLAVCASLAIAAAAPKKIVTKSVIKTPAAPAQIKDSAMQQIDQFITTSKIDKAKPGWKTSLPKPPIATFDKEHTYFARMVTNKGTVLIKFLPDVAPMHVTNFLYLTKLGFYDGIPFHRVITSFMAQGGCPLGTGTGNPGYGFNGEFSPTVKHTKGGLLSMANAGPGTDGSQFFLTFVATPWLDGKHTIFGEVVEGMDVVKTLEAAGSQSGKTSEPLSMTKVTVEVK